jgi:hypothetical protein
LRVLKSVPNGVSRSFGTISALGLVQYVADVRSHSIETDRQSQRDLLVCSPAGEQMQNFDFARREVIRKCHATFLRVQQGIDVDNQARHFKSTRELLGIPELLKSQAAVRIRLLCNQEGAVSVLRPSQKGPRAHGAI